MGGTKAGTCSHSSANGIDSQLPHKQIPGCRCTAKIRMNHAFQMDVQKGLFGITGSGSHWHVQTILGARRERKRRKGKLKILSTGTENIATEGIAKLLAPEDMTSEDLRKRPK
jgi:hypothetical protein